jgi:hypothetical protein
MLTQKELIIHFSSRLWLEPMVVRFEFLRTMGSLDYTFAWKLLALFVENIIKRNLSFTYKTMGSIYASRVCLADF